MGLKMKTKRKIKEPIKNYGQEIEIVVEKLLWSLYDTITIPAGIELHKDSRLYAFTDPISFRKPIAETNMEQACMLSAPQSFRAMSLVSSILPPYIEYEKDIIQRSFICHLWIGQKLQGQGAIGSYTPIKEEIARGQYFKVELVSCVEFKPISDIKIKIELQGELSRSLC